MKFLSLFLVFVFLLSCSTTTVEEKNPLEGVWKIEEITIVDANGQTTDVNVQRSLVIFTGGHYSYVYTFGDDLRKLPAEHWNKTDVERIDAFKTLVVNTGTYELTESRLVFRPIAAKAEEFVGGYSRHDYRLEGDALYLELIEFESVGGVQLDLDSRGRAHHKLSRVQNANRLTNK